MLSSVAVTINAEEKAQTILFLTEIDFYCANQDFTDCSIVWTQKQSYVLNLGNADYILGKFGHLLKH